MKASLPGAWPRLGAMAHELAIKPDEIQRLVSLLQSFGLGAVQLGVPLLEEVLAKKKLIARWRAQLESSALPMVALGGYRNLVAPNATKRRANIAFLQRCLELAPPFGTALVATETGTRNRESEWAPSPENQGKAAFLQQFKDRFVLAHLKDVSQEGAESDTPAFGQGVFPQLIYLDFLRNERPDVPLILEHVSVDLIPVVLQKLREVLA